MINVFVDCIPPETTFQGKKVGKTFSGKAVLYKTSKQKEIERYLSGLFLRHRPKSPLIGPLRFDVSFFFPYRKTEKKINIKRGAPIYKTTIPDSDNLAKGLQDVLSSLGYWSNDSQVVQLISCKYWWKKPGIRLSIQELKQEELDMNHAGWTFRPSRTALNGYLLI